MARNNTSVSDEHGSRDGRDVPHTLNWEEGVYLS